MDFCIILANFITVVILFLIAVYCWLDKKRFYVERQFRAASELFDEWMEHAERVVSCEGDVIIYRTTRSISKKYCALGRVSESAWGHETPVMKEIAGELRTFLGVYHALAEDYNRQLNSRFTGRIASILGFNKFPNIQMETEHV